MSDTNYVHFQHGSLWTEAFGDSSNPLVVLIAGAEKQGLYWHQSMCQSLAQKGYYVVRFDHRDTGLSSFIDFNAHPYRLDNLVQDVLRIIHFYEKKHAHVIGCGMGGYLAQMMAVAYPETLKSLVLLMTTHDARAIEQKSKVSDGLPATAAVIINQLDHLQRIASYDPDYLGKSVEKLRILNGPKAPFDKEEWEAIILNLKIREKTKKPSVFFHHHVLAKALSPLVFKSDLVTQPTTIIHGDADPMIPLQHAYSLRKIIPHATLEVIEGMGHLLTSHFETRLIEKIIKHLNKSNK
eukprot:gene24538-31958_t